MNEEEILSVLIIDQNLAHRGAMANAAFVLGLTAGRLMSDHLFGHDVEDRSGAMHRYLTRIPHFVKKAGQGKIRSLREALLVQPQVSIVDYPEEAAPSNYSVYAQNLSMKGADEITYRAIHVAGSYAVLYPLTKNLSRLES